MIFVYVITLVVLVAYAILLAYYHRSFMQMPDNRNIPAAYHPSTAITVLVPARNEAHNIIACMNAVLAQHYPQNLLQCIIIDDHSEDGTADMVKQCKDPRVELITLSDSLAPGAAIAYKKKAIEAGIAKATGELIVTTDADCTAGPDWLRSIAFTFEKKGAVLIAGPVKMNPGNGFLYIFQALDFMTLQGITAASVYKGFHSMGNGANLAYTRQSFIAVEGFRGIDSLASGDDMLLMHKIALRFPGKIEYLKSSPAIVSTEPANSWKAFLQQRIRWASKARAYEDKSVFWVLLLVYSMNALLFLILVSSFFSLQQLLWAILFLAIKTGIEWPFMHSVTSFFNEKSLLNYFPFLQPIHIVYTVIAGSFGQFGSYEWKGRRVS